MTHILKNKTCFSIIVANIPGLWNIPSKLSTISDPLINSNIYESLKDLTIGLYNIIHNNISSIKLIKIASYYESMLFTVFEIVYEHGLIIYNTDNRIKISSIFPEAIILDTIIEKLLPRNIKTNPISSNSPPRVVTAHNIKKSELDYCDSIPDLKNERTVPNIKNILPKKMPTGFSQKSVIAKNAISESKNRKKAIPTEEELDKQKMDQFDEEYELEREKKRLDRIKDEQQIKLINIFITDKKMYPLVKADIAIGKMKQELIHPNYIMKYQILKILEDRSVINFNTDTNIQEEFTLFSDLYDSCMEDIIDKKTADSPGLNVYVPHNYEYLSEHEKNECAKKYNMNRIEFESKHVAKNSADDMIIDMQIRNEKNNDVAENILNNIQKISDYKSKIESIFESDTESDSDTDSDSESTSESDDTDIKQLLLNYNT